MSEDIKDNAPAPEVEKTRYSDEELAEFKVIINDKLDKARKEYDTLRKVIMHNGSNDIEDTTPSWLRGSTSSSRILRRLLSVSRTKPTASAASLVNLFPKRGFVLCRTRH